MGKTWLLTLFCLLIALCISGEINQVQANEWELLGGAELTSEGEAVQYLGAGLIRPIRENWRLMTRIMGLHVNYKFNEDDDTLEGNLFSVTPSLGIRYVIYNGSLTLLGGLDIARVDQERQTGSNEIKRKLGAAVQAELDKWWAGANNVSVIMNYKSTDDFFWGRIRGKRKIGQVKAGSVFLGAETVGMGNEDFSSFGIGGIIEGANIISNLSCGLKTGFKHTNNFEDSIYGGIEFYFSY
jgi:hypothetical protein